MTTSLVSILIPCHNGAAHLAETLDSALAQTYPAIEIILVDDASTDDSRAIAAAKGPKINVLANAGRGASAARNHATRHARGEFIQYLDADDLLLPDAIARRVAALASSDADLSISDWVRLHPSSAGIWSPGRIESGRLPTGIDPDLAIFNGFWAPPVALLYRKTLIDRLPPWSENLPVIQDARFMFEAARHGARIVHTQGVDAHYRQHAHGSLSSSDPARFWRDVFTNTREIEAGWRAGADPARLAAIRDSYGLIARMGFIHDGALYEAARKELRRFPDFRPSRFLRAAFLLTRLLGQRAARRLLADLGRRRS